MRPLPATAEVTGEVLPSTGTGMNEQAPVTVQASALASMSACGGTFVARDLDHQIESPSDPVLMFDGTGAGMAINDLDNDGDLDIVLANLVASSAIFWNQGNLEFEKETLDQKNARGAAAVDVDGDGWQDIVFSTPPGSIRMWRNLGNYDAADAAHFASAALPGVNRPVYAFNWADLDLDGDLDLITGSYDAALEKLLGDAFMNSAGAGVFIYTKRGAAFDPERLADSAQALAVLPLDLNNDNRMEIVVGNDFTIQDQVWTQTENGWEQVALFDETTHSTMSFDGADIDNSGQVALLATDMRPYADDEQTRAAWQPMMDMMPREVVPGDPQIMENTLQIPMANDGYLNQAQELGASATGWSWSSKFGDLDNDGYVDIYVVNGMFAVELFSHLPGDELVEENQALRNTGGEGNLPAFVPAPEWGLNGTRSGRGMSMADLDMDGDLDVVVNNMLAPAQIFENQLCEGASIQVDLHWPSVRNHRAIGAYALLVTDQGTVRRDVRAVSGYLSGDPARLHFGFPADAQSASLAIHWPDGLISRVEAVEPGQLLSITRD